MTLQSPTATLMPLISSSELTECGYPGLLDRKNRSDMCPRWESNPRLPACKASTLSTRPGSPLNLSCRTYPCRIVVQCYIYKILVALATQPIKQWTHMLHTKQTTHLHILQRKPQLFNVRIISILISGVPILRGFHLKNVC